MPDAMTEIDDMLRELFSRSPPETAHISLKGLRDVAVDKDVTREDIK